jgi:hypothetical protein
MLSVPEQILGASGTRKKEGKNVLVGFLDVAGGAGEDEVVAAIVGAFSFARRNVIERDSLRAYATPAIGADRPVPTKQPLACVGISVPAGRERGVLLRGPSWALRPLARAFWAAAGAQRSIGWGERRDMLFDMRLKISSGLQGHASFDFSMSLWRSIRRNTLPAADLGSSSTNSYCDGTL